MPAGGGREKGQIQTKLGQREEKNHGNSCWGGGGGNEWKKKRTDQRKCSWRAVTGLVIGKPQKGLKSNTKKKKRIGTSDKGQKTKKKRSRHEGTRGRVTKKKKEGCKP